MSDDAPAQPGFVVRPVGFVRSPLTSKVDVARQPTAVGSVEARIEVEPAWVDALADLEGFSRIWVVFVFHEALGAARTRVQPPRSSVRRGVFATRSPHRPNPIGLSAVRLLGVEGRDVRVEGLDALDGTPVLDLKPYLAYADAFPDAAGGWLEDEATRDPVAPWVVRFAEEAEASLAFLAGEGLALRDELARRLALGPKPHAYRRIRRAADGRGAILALGAFRARFVERGERTLEVVRVRSGYRPKELARAASEADPADLALHRAFDAAFPGPV